MSLLLKYITVSNNIHDVSDTLLNLSHIPSYRFI